MDEVSQQSHEEWLDAYESSGQGATTPSRQTEYAPYDQHDETGPVHQAPRKERGVVIMPPDESSELVPEGIYVSRCLGYKVRNYWGDCKLIFKFEICQGKFAGTQLDCFFNIATRRSRAGETILAPKPRQTYTRLMKQLFNDKLKSGDDWISPENLVGKRCEVEVVTVTKNHANEDLGLSQYSKIDPNIKLLS